MAVSKQTISSISVADRKPALSGLATQALNVRALLDGRGISGYQRWIIGLCFLAVLMDGFDVVIMGFVGPALKAVWHWSNDDLAPVLSAALAGLTLGALVAGPLGDHFGRRRVLCSSVMLFGVFTLLVATATDRSHFIIYRFVAGLAMGGIMPMAATLATEYAPAGRRSLLVTIVFAGFTAGAAGGGFLAAWLVPHWGWPSVFIFGGVVPMLLSLVMAGWMPESLTYLVHRQGNQQKIRRIVECCAPGSTTSDTVFVLPSVYRPQENQQKPVLIVLNSHYRAGSLMLWGIYFLHLFLVYLLGSWMPIMLKDSGMSVHQASIVSAMFQLGGPLGSIMLGWLMDRFEGHRVLASAYFLGALALVLLGHVGEHFALMCMIAFVIGAGLNGGGTGMNALSSHFFPLQARATGNGWMHGIGRIGAVISAFAGAWILNAGWGLGMVTLVLTVPPLLIGTLLLIKYLRYR
ncbi:MAG: aromatic acid/H+ symport family MFS transporter [Lautropia sp.]|nr:aromatic acid/H+ symport family MFS transporter [Lautropia sp.]